MIFKECNKFLDKFNHINEGLTYITKLFCIGYISHFIIHLSKCMIKTNLTLKM
jgi:hypothetical protein